MGRDRMEEKDRNASEDSMMKLKYGKLPIQDVDET